MLKLITIRRQGTIAVLGRNLAVRVLMEKTARLESRDTTINDVGHEGTATENQVAPDFIATQCSVVCQHDGQL